MSRNQHRSRLPFRRTAALVLRHTQISSRFGQNEFPRSNGVACQTNVEIGMATAIIVGLAISAVSPFFDVIRRRVLLICHD
ncbi:MAG: hypothetical protein IPP74_13030 [Alphaproteobacteria bacterium]|nr:hypothetical protein [Alphaproteobacteria bacterium]